MIRCTRLVTRGSSLVVLGTCLFAVALAPAAESAPPAATVLPTAVAPRMGTAPQIDGKIGPGEWETLHVAGLVARGEKADRDLLQPRLGEFWVGWDEQNLYLAMRSAVHPARGPKAVQGPPEGIKDSRNLVTEDSIEIWFDMHAGDRDAHMYQFFLNPLGALSDTWMRLKYNAVRTTWRAEGLRQAHSVQDGIWTAEIAIPLASLQVEDRSLPMALRMCRNYQDPHNQSRWAPGVTAYDDRATMPRIRLDPNAPVIQELSFQDAQGVHVALRVANTTAAAIPVKVRIGGTVEGAAREDKDWTAELAPGAEQAFAWKAAFPPSEDGAVHAEIRVTGAGDEVLYHRDIKWRPAEKPQWDPAETNE